jgi:ABC-type sulfate transport system permease component
MLTWLLGVAVFVVIWGALWRSQPKLAFGVLLGLPLAWIFSRLITPYVTGMNEIPIWLPPLPFAIVALTLMVFGAVVWFRADSLRPVKREPQGHGTHGGH